MAVCVAAAVVGAVHVARNVVVASVVLEVVGVAVVVVV